jgi:hypothetical protein
MLALMSHPSFAVYVLPFALEMLGFYRTFMDLGGFAGPIVLLFVYASWSSQAAFWVAVLINIVNILLLITVKIKPVSNH